VYKRTAAQRYQNRMGGGAVMKWGGKAVHKSHKKKTSQGDSHNRISLNMNKGKKRSFKKYKGQGR
jgi:hypothetical protein